MSHAPMQVQERRPWGYVLNGRDVQAVYDIDQFAAEFEVHVRIVGRYRRRGVIMSTVFLGIDHNFRGRGAPVLFETAMHCHGRWDVMLRYETWEQAHNGHQIACEELRKILRRGRRPRSHRPRRRRGRR